MDKESVYTTVRNYLSQYPISKTGIFGSFAPGEESEESDIDILVSCRETINLLTLVRMHRELSELLNRKVDIVREKYLRPKLKGSIRKDLHIIYSR